MASHTEKNFYNCACYTVLYTYEAAPIVNCPHDSRTLNYHTCDCYEACYACNMTFYGNQSQYKTSYPQQTCICNQQCYQESSSCACNASCHLEARACTCYERRYGCGTNENCTCNESCDGYQSCECDEAGHNNICRQCHLATYDTNSPAYNCSCDLACDSYTIPDCNCDGKYQAPDTDICQTNTIQEECGQSYSNNICTSYISSRYY